MYRLKKHKIFSGIAKGSICLILLISMISCSDISVDSEGFGEEYIFLDLFILSYAKQLEGDCTFPDISEPAILFTYDPIIQSLIIKRGKPFPLNDDLQMVMGILRVFAPLAGVNNINVRVIPVYYIPDQLTEHIRVSGLVLDNLSVQISMGFESNSSHTIRIPTILHLAADSTFEKVFKTIEGGMTESNGDSCIWEYTDSLVITNYGLNPKSKISWEPIAAPK